MFILEVFDIDFHRYGIVQSYKMVKYTNKFADIGSFELICAVTKENVDLIQKDRIIWLEDNVAGIIQYVNKKRGDDTQMVVRGMLFAEVLNWRYVYPTVQATLPANDIMEKMVNDNCVNAQLTSRNYSFLSIVKTNYGLPNITKQKTGDTVSKGLTEVAEANSLGYEVGFYPREKKAKFEVLQGSDRTPGNSQGNKPVFFSQELNNIIKSEYTTNSEDYRNVALVSAEKGETERVTMEVTNVQGVSLQGFERRELYVDARDLQSDRTDDEGNIVAIPEEEYNRTLQERGFEKLADAKQVESFSGEVRNDAGTIFHYGKDYFLGDIVGIKDSEMNVSTTAIVTAVTVTQTEKEYTVEPTFGFGQPTIMQKLKRKGVV